MPDTSNGAPVLGAADISTTQMPFAIYDDARADALVAQGVQGVMDRLGMCKEILSVRARLAQASATSIQAKARANALAQRRINAIRSLLLPAFSASGSATAVDDLLVPATAKKTLNALLEEAQQAGASERVATGLLVGDLVLMLKKINAAELDLGLTSTNLGLLDVAEAARQLMGTAPEDTPSHQRAHILAKPIVDAAIEAGKFTPELHEMAQTAAEQASDAKSANSALFAPEEMAELNQMRAKWEAYKASLEEISQAKKAARELGGADGSAYAVASEAYAKLYEEYLVWHQNVYKVRSDVLIAEVKKKRADFVAQASGLHAKTLEALNQDNPVSQEQAEDWAKNKVQITPAAVARLRKIGYTADAVRKDFAEFYRFTRGRVDKLVIDTKGDSRANATDINSHGKAGVIYLDGNFNKVTLWHEGGHHIEADPAARAAAALFIRQRSESEHSYTLRSLTGNKGYGAGEVAFKGGFFSPYVGKVYRDGFTEVFSMGCETFADPALLATRMAKDPQTLEFVLGYIRSPKTVLAQLHQSMRESMRETTEDADAQAEDATATRIKELADSLTLENIDPTPWLTRINGQWLVERNSAQFIGAVKAGETTLYVYSSKRVRNRDTKRYGAGYIVYVDDGVDLYITELSIATKDQQSMRAVVATWAKAAAAGGDFQDDRYILSGKY